MYIVYTWCITKLTNVSSTSSFSLLGSNKNTRNLKPSFRGRIKLIKMQSVVISSGRVSSYNSLASNVYGSIQIFLGVMCIITNILGMEKLLSNYSRYMLYQFMIGHGFWGGGFVGSS